MMSMLKNFKQLNLCVIFSIFLAMNSSNWFLMWMTMELNLLSLLPIIMPSYLSCEIESMIMYLIPNTIASSFILFSNLLTQKEHSSIYSDLMLLALILKMGIFPFHLWIPPIFNMTTWWLIMLIMTAQKLTPIFIFNSLLKSTLLPIIMLIMNAFIMGLMGVTQSNMRPLLCYSSLHHSSWIIMPTAIFKDSTLLYLILYLPLIFIISSTMMKSKTSSSFQYSFISSLPYSLIMVSLLTVVSLAGIPPLYGFAPKLIILWDMITFSLVSSSLMILSSSPTMFFYIMVFLALTLNMKKSQTYHQIKLNFWFPSMTMSPLFMFLYI